MWSIKTIAMIILVVFFLGGTLLGTFEGFVKGVNGQGWDKFIESTGGTFVSNEQRVINAAEELQKNPNNETYKEFLTRQIWVNVGITLAMLIFIYFGLGMLSQSQNVDIGGKMLQFSFSIILLAFVQVAYGAFVLNEFIFPFKGIFYLITHWDVLSIVLSGTSADAFLNASANITTTVGGST